MMRKRKFKKTGLRILVIVMALSMMAGFNMIVFADSSEVVEENNYPTDTEEAVPLTDGQETTENDDATDATDDTNQVIEENNVVATTVTKKNGTTIKATGTYTDGKGIVYEVDDSTMTAIITATPISGTLTGSMATVSVPSGYGVTAGDYKITEISGDNAFELWTLTNVSFDNLKTITGAEVFKNAGLTGVDFTNLADVAGTLYDFANATLVNTDFPALVTITGRSVFSLATIDSDCDFSALKIIEGTSAFSSAKLTGVDFTNLADVAGAGYDFTNAILVDTDFPALTTITGETVFMGAIIDGDCDFSALKKIEGNYAFIETTLTGVDFTNLADVAGANNDFAHATLVDTDFPALATITGGSAFLRATIDGDCDFSALKKIEGDNAFSRAKLTGVDFTNLADVAGTSNDFLSATLVDTDFPALTTITGGRAFQSAIIDDNCDFSALKKIEGNYDFYTAKLSISAFYSLETISGSDAFSYCDLTGIGFPALKTISGNNCFLGTTIENDKTFPALVSVTGSNIFISSAGVETIRMPVLTQIGGSYSFWNNTTFADYYVPSTPPTVGNTNNFLDCSSVRYVHPPTIADMPKYAAVAADGDKTDKYWYGWTLTDISWVNFDANGGTLQGTDDGYRVGNNGAKLSGSGTDISNIAPDPTPATGMIFDGWYTAPTGGTKVTDFYFPATEYDTVTYYAHYKSTYTVTFDSDGGSTVSSQSVVDGEKATEPTNPTKAGFVFEGWLDENGNAFDFSTPITKDTTLKAKWTALYTVTFDSDGGSDVASQIVKDGSTIIAPTDPVKAGYTFGGWFDASGSLFSFQTVITGDTTLTAHWNAIVAKNEPGKVVVVKDETPNTGDDSNMMLWMLITLIGAMTTGGAIAIKKKREKKQY